MATHDLAVRQELIADGSLGKYGYHPRMEAVHQSNAARLISLIDQHGWPGRSLVGEDGAEAAWLIAQHAIGIPPFMRECLLILQQAGLRGEAPCWQAAMLEDRIRMFEGRPQIYGTQFRPGDHGEPVSHPIEDPAGVDDRRRAVGLNTLEERTAELREQAAREKIEPLADREAHQREYETWLRRVGWRQ